MTIIYSAAASGSSQPYSIGGAARAYLQVEAAAGTATAVVTVKQRMGPLASWQTIKVINNPTAGDVAYALEPVGEIMLDVAWTAGIVIATLAANYDGGRGIW